MLQQNDTINPLVFEGIDCSISLIVRHLASTLSPVVKNARRDVKDNTWRGLDEESKINRTFVLSGWEPTPGQTGIQAGHIPNQDIILTQNKTKG